MYKILFVILLAISSGLPLKAYNESPLFVFLGDSNLWIGGDDCSKENAWSHWVCKHFNAQGISFARSGATWTCTPNTNLNTSAYSEVIDDQNVIYNQIARLLDVDWQSQYGQDPDVIFLAAGTNDAWFEAKREGIYSMSANEAWTLCEQLIDAPPSHLISLAAALTNAIATLAESFEDSKIVVLTPPFATACSSDKIMKVSNIIVDVMDKWKESVTIIRLDSNSLIDADKERVAFSLTTDGTHTNPNGAKVIANKVIETLK